MGERSNITKNSTELGTDKETKARSATPPVDIFENDKHIVLRADMPGVDPENLDVQLDNAELKVAGTQVADQRFQQTPLIFRRSFRMPNTVVPEGVNAVLKDGVLEVRIQKTEAAGPRKIEVRAG